MLSILTAPFRFVIRKFRAQSWKRKVVIVIGLVIVVFVANGIFNKPDPKAQYQLEPVKIGSISEIISETGNITTAGVAPMYSTTTGIVDKVFVKNGDVVAANAPLFSVKATATKQQKDAALASYLQAKASLEAAKAQQLALQAQMFSQWDAYKELAESDEYEDADGNPKYDQRNLPEFHVPEKQWLSAEAAYKNQAQVIAQASVAASAAWQQYQSTQDSQVIAILPGSVENLAVAVGDLVDIKGAPSAYPALVLVVNNADTIVRVQVSETDISKLSPGMEASVELDAIGDKTFAAVVDRVDSVAVGSAGVVEYAVYVKLVDTDQKILAGMTADVDIKVSSRDNVLTVPSSAVKPYEGGRAVRVLDETSKIKFVPVEVGITGEGLVEILSGIEEGTEVVTALTNEQVRRAGPGGFL